MTAPAESGATFRLAELTEDLRSMAETVRAVVDAMAPIERTAAIADGADYFDSKLWLTLADDLGVTGLLVPEELGGLGLGWLEARVVLAELGRTLACVPFLNSCIVAVSVILASQDADAAAEILPGIAEGRSIVAVAIGDDALLPPAARSRVTARIDDEGQWRLTGDQPFVVHGMIADRILMLGVTEDGSHGWFVVDATADGLARTAMTVVDTTRPQATLSLASVPARLIGHRGPGDDLVVQALDAAVIGAACENMAASQHLLDLTVAYASTRFQFGQPIGSFQALQHRLADLKLAVDTSVSAVEYAVAAQTHDHERITEAASIAGFVCTETFYRAALETIQIHGGIGFTWEHQAHRYYRRALASRALLGAPSFHRERLLQSLSI